MRHNGGLFSKLQLLDKTASEKGRSGTRYDMQKL